MIVSFNPDIFLTEDDEINSTLSHIFNILLSDRCLVDISSVNNLFFDANNKYIFNESPFAQQYLAKAVKIKLEDFIAQLLLKNAYLTEMHLTYLTHFRIGTLQNEIHPLEALNILGKPSKIILENGINDWKFIEGIVEKYRNHKTRKSIYSLIKKSIDNTWLESDNAGGKGQIKARIEYYKTKHYTNTLKYKIAALFDSDRRGPTELEHQIKLLIEWIKGHAIDGAKHVEYHNNDSIYWHMLYKRELENYIPLEIIVRKIQHQFNCDGLVNMPVEELDYIKYEKYITNNQIDVKSEFPNYFLEDFTRDRLEARCGAYRVSINLPNGTLEQVSEIESILLKIARII